jgi:hypothetical protein
VAIHDAGVYTCVARNAMGQVQTQAQLSTIGKSDSDFQSKSSWGAVQQMEMSKTSVTSSSITSQEVSVKQVIKIVGVQSRNKCSLWNVERK